MKQNHLFVLVLTSIFCFPGSACPAESAATEAEESESTMMREVVVTAARYEEQITTVPANATVITEEDIANSTAKDIPGVLRTQVGIHVTDVTGNGRTYKVDLRGFGETAQSNTLVLVDGRRINEPDLSGTDWTLIPLDRVKKIEIIRGSGGSVLYGDNATGGVINIITKEGEKFKAGADMASGSFDTFKGNAYLSGSKDSFSYALSGRYYQSDGYRDNSDTDARQFGANLGYIVGDFMRLTLSGGYHDDDTALPGALTRSELEANTPRTATTHPEDFADTQDSYVQFKSEAFFFQTSLFQIPLSYRKRDTTFFSSFAGGTFEGNTDIKTAIASPQFVISEPIKGFENNLTFGMDFVSAEEDIVNQSLFFGSLTIGEFNLDKRNYSLFIHDKFYPMDSLALSVGYRYDAVKYEFSPSIPDEANYSENLYTAGINYTFYKESYAYFSYSRGFRYPLLDELFNFLTNTISTDLIPQTSPNYELGVRYYFAQNIYTHLNFFRLITKDEIFFNPKTFSNENLDGETRRDGVEISLGAKLESIYLVGTYTYTNAEVEDGQFAGNEVPGVPKHMASFDSVFDLGRGFTLALNGKYVGKRFLESDYANAFPEQDDFVLFNAKLKYACKGLTVYLDVNNLFDEEYAQFGILSLGYPKEPAFYPSPERNFLVGVRYDY
jgi:iron complex outermembrane receptor protein